MNAEQKQGGADSAQKPSQWGRAHLNHMGDEGVEALYSRVSRQRERMEDSQAEADAVDGSDWQRRYVHICEVEAALELAIGFLNGEYQAFKEGGAS